jgi:hypothetical protein
MLVAQNSITQTAGLIEGASNLTLGDAVKQIVSTIADRIQTGTLDFTKSEQVADLIVQVGDRVKAIDPNFNAQEISVAAPALAQVIAGSNQRIVSAIHKSNASHNSYTSHNSNTSHKSNASHNSYTSNNSYTDTDTDTDRGSANCDRNAKTIGIK